MAHPYRCFEHTERPVVAYCDQCAKPCCRDCSVELFEQYFCPRCKALAVEDLKVNAVVPDALRAVVIGAVGIVIAGFVLGPYAIWRAHQASVLIERAPWFRGRWHVRAAYILGGLATFMGVLSLVAKFLIQTPAGS